MSSPRRTAVLVLLVASLSACGGSSSIDDTASGGNDGVPVDCAGSPRPELMAPDGWTVCADSGLAETADEFSFENWGGPVTSDAFTPQLMVTMFGFDNTCMPEATGCVLYPAAQQWMDQMNAAIEGGRCEGMATLSQRLNLERDTAGSLQAGATTASELSRDTAEVGSSIARWWASQTFDEVRATTEPTRDWSPSRMVDEVVAALNASAGPTLGLYGNGEAHAVTPIAVSTDNAGQYVIHVYDNNYPGRILPLYIDTSAETWAYDMAAANAGEESEQWGGGTGTMDLTLLDSREKATSAPWSNESVTKGSTVVTASSRGKTVVGLQITAGSTIIDTRDPSTWVDGIDVFPMRGALAGTGVSVVVPPSVGRTTVKAIVGDSVKGTPVNLVMTVDFPGRGSTQIETEVVDGEEFDSPSFSFEGDEGDYSFEADGSGDIRLEYAFGEEEVNYDLSGDVTFKVDEGDDSSDLALLGSDGEEVWQSEFDGEDDDGIYGSYDIAFDDATGNLVESETAFESFDVSDDAGEATTDTSSDTKPTDSNDGTNDVSTATEAPSDTVGDQPATTDPSTDDTTP